MRVIHIALLLAAIPGHLTAANPIGSEVPPYPDGWIDIGGACVGGPPDDSDICDYSIGVLEDPRSGLFYVYAGKSLRQKDETSSRWLVTDVLNRPKPPEGYDLSISACRRNGVHDRTIFAVVRTDENDEEWHKEVSWAHKLDIKQQKFVPLDPGEIDCQNESWGL